MISPYKNGKQLQMVSYPVVKLAGTLQINSLDDEHGGLGDIGGHVRYALKPAGDVNGLDARFNGLALL